MTTLHDFLPWLAANTDALLLGSLVAAVLVIAMLSLRWLGYRIVTRDPSSLTWKGVIGRVLSKTSLAFMVATAADTVARYADMPPRPEHLLFVLFTIAGLFADVAVDDPEDQFARPHRGLKRGGDGKEDE